MAINRVTSDHPESKSLDVVTHNIEQLKRLFPEVVVDGKIDFDVLRQILGDAVDDKEEKFGLNWHGKRQARQLALTPSTGTLLPCPEESVDWDTTKNIFIEGDNLEVLKLLQKSYAGRVKMIYIDPPYNTGQDFVYPDDFQNGITNYLELTGQVASGRTLLSNTESGGRFHTDWLNMLYPRLRVARHLLRDDGVIFVSIDDKESAHLKQMLDEVFGEENYIDTIAVEMSTTSGPKTVNAQQGTIVKNVEFVHIYSKSDQFDKTPHSPLLDGIDSYDTHYSLWLNEDGTLEALADKLALDKTVGRDITAFRMAERGKFSINNLNKLLMVSNAAKEFIESNLQRIARVDRPPVSAAGQNPAKGKWESFEVDHRKYFLTTTANGSLQALMPLALNYRMSDDYKPRFGRTVIRGDLWKGFYQDMGNVAKEGDVPFANGKKPVRLIKQLMKWAGTSNNGIILDFFAGSGTTAHAVMQLNSEDKGDRRYILVQLPEPLDVNDKEQRLTAEFCDMIHKPRNIAELTKERLRRAGREVHGENQIFAGDQGYRVFRLDASNIRAWATDRNAIAQALQDNIQYLKVDREPTDILYELLLKRGLDLCVPIETKTIAGKKVHSVGAGSLIACLDTKITRADGEALAFGIAKWHKELNPAGETAVVFRDDAFADDVVKTNVAAILEQHGLKNVRSL